MLHVLWSSIALAGSPGAHVHVMRYEGHTYHVVSVDLRQASIDLYGQGERGQPRTFDDLAAVLDRESIDLVAATNAGIYHSVSRPVGLFVEEGQTLSPLHTGEGFGNFFLKPNGVFWLDGRGAHVADSAGWTAPEGLRIATQSGPALVLDGQIHPHFLPESRSELIRSGVGVAGADTVHLVLSDDPVNFYDFAVFFRDVLDSPNALYLDGTISALWTPRGVHGRDHERWSGFLVVSEN